MSDICNEKEPGTLCTPRAHHPACRYAGTEPKDTPEMSERSWRLIAALAALDAKEEG